MMKHLKNIFTFSFKNYYYLCIAKSKLRKTKQLNISKIPNSNPNTWSNFRDYKNHVFNNESLRNSIKYLKVLKKLWLKKVNATNDNTGSIFNHWKAGLLSTFW